MTHPPIVRRVTAACGLLAALAAAPSMPGAVASAQRRPELPRLLVSPDGRSLVTANGRPFLHLSDTAWELFHTPCGRCTHPAAFR